MLLPALLRAIQGGHCWTNAWCCAPILSVNKHLLAQQQQGQQLLHQQGLCGQSALQQACAFPSADSFSHRQFRWPEQQLHQLQWPNVPSCRNFSSSSQFSSTTSVAGPVQQPQGDSEQLQQQQQQTSSSLQQADVLAKMPGTLYKHPLFWNGLSSKIKSRKPAIKSPARHQWRYCAEDYDPMQPYQATPLPPYAPLRAHTKDYNKIFHETKPQFRRGRYRRLWQKNMAIADQRWRKAWELKLAAERKREERVQRLAQRLIRERSWTLWQLQNKRGAFAATPAAPEAPAGAAPAPAPAPAEPAAAAAAVQPSP